MTFADYFAEEIKCNSRYSNYFLAFNAVTRAINMIMSDQATGDDQAFLRVLQHELSKINYFSSLQASTLLATMRRADGEIERFLDGSGSKSSQYEDMKLTNKRVDECGQEIAFLVLFARLNFFGFRELCDEYDRRSGSQSSIWFMSKLIEEPFLSIPIDGLLALFAQTAAKIRSCGLPDIASEGSNPFTHPLSSTLNPKDRGIYVVDASFSAELRIELSKLGSTLLPPGRPEELDIGRLPLPSSLQVSDLRREPYCNAGLRRVTKLVLAGGEEVPLSVEFEGESFNSDATFIVGESEEGGQGERRRLVSFEEAKRLVLQHGPSMKVESRAVTLDLGAQRTVLVDKIRFTEVREVEEVQGEMEIIGTEWSYVNWVYLEVQEIKGQQQFKYSLPAEVQNILQKSRALREDDLSLREFGLSFLGLSESSLQWVQNLKNFAPNSSLSYSTNLDLAKDRALSALSIAARPRTQTAVSKPGGALPAGGLLSTLEEPLLPQKKTYLVEPKSFYANERTLVSWLNACVLLLTMGGISVSHGAKSSQLGGLFPLLLTAFAGVFVWWAFVVYLRRARLLRQKIEEGKPLHELNNTPMFDATLPTVFGSVAIVLLCGVLYDGMSLS